jgi:glycosyltransferase involved in cell wall biosynthesis
MSQKKISFVLPFYNEEGNIEKLYIEVAALLTEVEKKYSTEVICVNDGSRDNTLELLIGLHNKDKRFKVINFARNFGHQIAITAGMDNATGDAIIIMDSDLQDPPQVSLDLITKWEEGYEVVYAQRKTRKDTFFKRTSAYVFYRLLDSLANIRIPKDTGDFRLLDKKVVNALKSFEERNRFVRGMISYIGFKQTGVLFDRDERFAGKTHYPLSKMIRFAIDGITSFSTVPLQLISQLGFVVSFLSFIGIVYAIIMRLFFPEITVSGWTFIVIAILFIGGVQMIMLGILGTYIGRIYTEVQKRPLYIISSKFE